MHPLFLTATRTPGDGVLIQSTALADWGFFAAAGLGLFVGIVFAKDVFQELRYAWQQNDLARALWREKTRILKFVLPVFVCVTFAIHTGLGFHGYHRMLDKAGLTIGEGSQKRFFSWHSLSGHSGRINSENFWLEFTGQGQTERIVLDQLILKYELQDHIIKLVQQQLSPQDKRIVF